MPATCARTNWPIAASPRSRRAASSSRGAAQIPAFPFAPACRRDGQRPRCPRQTPRAPLPCGRTRRAPARAASTPPCIPGPARQPGADEMRRAPRRPLSYIRCRANSATTHRPCRRRAFSGSWPVRPWVPTRSFAYQFPALAADPPHRIDDFLVLAVDLALDGRVEPSIDPAAIQDVFRKLVTGIRERVDRVLVIGCRGRELERGFLLARRDRNV